VNRRVSVLDADTGAFKRMSGAYGDPPDDAAANLLGDEGPGPRQFNLVAFSPDPQQEFLFLADAGNGRIHIFDRRTLDEVAGFGRIGHYAGEFEFLHNVATESRGNVYTAEVGTKRVQKFLEGK
jgi:hypothetical protein